MSDIRVLAEEEAELIDGDFFRGDCVATSDALGVLPFCIESLYFVRWRPHEERLARLEGDHGVPVWRQEPGVFLASLFAQSRV